MSKYYYSTKDTNCGLPTFNDVKTQKTKNLQRPASKIIINIKKDGKVLAEILAGTWLWILVNKKMFYM